MRYGSIPHYDVIIIGAGSVGTPAAFFLAQQGYKTLVLDQNASVGQGSNKKAIGGIRATHSDPAKIRLSLRSLDIFANWKERYGDDIEWYKGGYCFVAYREREEKTLKDLLVQQQAYGLNIHWLDDRQLISLVPDLNPDGLIGGSYSPDDGNASPLLVSHAFYTHAMDLGVEFRFNEPVTGVMIEGGKVKGVQTPCGKYGADIVINAAGPWAAEVGAMAGLNIPVRPDSHESAITEPVSRFLGPMIVDIRPAPGSSNYYFYQHTTGQIVFCITPSPQIWGFDTRETSDFLPMVARRMVEVMPRLKNIRVRRTWRGLYPMTPDGFPIVGWSKEVEGYLLAVGMCGQGFMLGPGIAELMVNLVENRISPELQEILSYLSPYRQFASQELLK
ncbi:MAG TPA: FAD-dependent oxidoreductase [Anaerolineaceae bacterium]|nr:FAD-dependent oxidoreductase [Anaerolineaceae bacterium]